MRDYHRIDVKLKLSYKRPEDTADSIVHVIRKYGNRDTSFQIEVRLVRIACNQKTFNTIANTHAEFPAFRFTRFKKPVRDIVGSVCGTHATIDDSLPDNVLQFCFIDVASPADYFLPDPYTVKNTNTPYSTMSEMR